jgi:hypothetical protein
MDRPVYIGQCALQPTQAAVSGEIVTIGGEQYALISNYDQIPPFFMSIVSNSDLWMFISSNGGLTAGRRNPEYSLFPYITDDQIHDSHEFTGSKTLLFINKHEKAFLWEPFSMRHQGTYRIQRHIYKNMISSHLIFEEVNHDLDVRFQYAWTGCDRFGFVKKARVRNDGAEAVSIDILDGIQNILPAGVGRRLQLEYSTLVDGYKKNELLPDSRLALYTLSSIPTDRAEPNEALRATTAWSTGLEDPVILLSSMQLDAFRRGEKVEQEIESHARRGAYFLSTEFTLHAHAEKEWTIVADVNKDQSDVASLASHLESDEDIAKQLEEEIAADSQRLKRRLSRADGAQSTGDRLNDFRHCSNTLFNIMRGGIFDNGYQIDSEDFRAFVQQANKPLYARHKPAFDSMPARLNLDELISRLPQSDPALEKLCYEYLPLSFSRRHGDPSRPWNQFSIDIKDDHGVKTLNYQGNWRDIFQNWEALALSFPEYIENMITKFVNACTADGYNPYRVTRDGFDWEVPNPSEPWANIGYWGDHQIIYLLKLLELSVEYHPGKIKHLLTKEIFAYANVPYRIKAYQDIRRNPRETIDFDFELNAEIERRVAETGTDGKFVRDEKGGIYHVNLTEKLLVLILVKLSNFIPEAGIWMNTQRPEWNDANNALVGYGTSMVTLYYLRRFIVFSMALFESVDEMDIRLSAEVVELYEGIKEGIRRCKDLNEQGITDSDRKEIADRFGETGSDHRTRIYERGFSGARRLLGTPDLISFLQTTLSCVDHSIQANEREDHLYHSYNLIDISGDNRISIRRMTEMLEGQVAVLSSGYLSHQDSAALIRALRWSALYREDQFSYMLYPNRILKRFMEKNVIPTDLLDKSGFLQQQIAQGKRCIVRKDESGNVHFASHFHNARLLEQSLEEYKHTGQGISENEIHLILEIYEAVFDHQSFTGRSGTFYKYEGLGSIYWHMVSKLLLAVQDTFFHACESGADRSILDTLKNDYYEIRKGIGHHKNPEMYGAFPTDPYSHTPKNSGAQQPGMTGQVKEDIISRFGELGVIVRDGKIRFNPVLLKESEFLDNEKRFDCFDVNGSVQSIQLDKGMLAFTICQVPVIYEKSNKDRVILKFRDGHEETMKNLEITSRLSNSIFNREDNISMMHVMVKQG